MNVCWDKLDKNAKDRFFKFYWCITIHGCNPERMCPYILCNDCQVLFPDKDPCGCPCSTYGAEAFNAVARHISKEYGMDIG